MSCAFHYQPRCKYNYYAIIGFFLFFSLSNNAVAQWIKRGATDGVSLGFAITTTPDRTVLSAGTYFCDLAWGNDTLYNSSCDDFSSTGSPFKYDVYIAAHDENGEELWVTSLQGTSGNEIEVMDMAYAAGTIGVCGHFSGELSSGFQTITTDENDAFLMLMTEGGNVTELIKPVTRLTTNATARLVSVTADVDGNIFCAGTFRDSVEVGGEVIYSENNTYIVIEYAQDGTLVNYFYGENTTESARSGAQVIRSHDNGSLYVAGVVNDTISLNGTELVANDLSFIARMDDAGTPTWIAKVNVKNIGALSLDAEGDVYISGNVQDGDILGEDTLQIEGSAVFLAAYTADGNFRWYRLLRSDVGQGSISAGAVNTDADGNVYLAGHFGADGGGVPEMVYENESIEGNEGIDAYVSRWGTDGTYDRTQALGGIRNAYGIDLAAMDESSVFLTGYYTGEIRVDTMVVSSQGALRAFLARLDNCPQLQANIAPEEGQRICEGEDVLLTTSEGNDYRYQWYENGELVEGEDGNTFSAFREGRYQARISSDAAGCTKFTLPVQVTVDPLPDTTLGTSTENQFLCEGDSVLFNGAFGYTYQWLRDNQPLEGETGYQFIAYEGGEYALQLENNEGCTATTRTVEITFLPDPVTTLLPEATRFSICEGDSIALSSQETDEEWSYQWLRNGSTYSGDSAVLYVQEEGRYQLEVTNIAGCRYTTPQDTVVVNPSPEVTITSGAKTAFCPDEPISPLRANSSGGYLHQWYKDGEPIPEATNARYTPDATGDYQVATSTSTEECTLFSDTVLIVIYPTPQVRIDQESPISLCMGENTELTVSGTAGTYDWLQNNAPHEVDQEVLEVTQQGAYAAEVTDENGCKATSNDVSVVVNPIPTAAVSADGPDAVCEGSVVSLSTTVVSGMGYEWFRNGEAVGVSTPSQEAAVTGDYTVEVTNQYACSAMSDPYTVTVFDQPPADIAYDGEASFCDGDSIALFATEGEGFTYQWRLNSFTLQDADSESYVTSQAGMYTVRVAVSDDCYAVSDEVNVTKRAFTQPEIRKTGPDISTSRYATYQWYRNGDMIPGATYQLYKVVEDGEYTVDVVAENGCEATADAVSMCVPVPEISRSGAQLTSTEGEAYQWYVNDEILNGAIHRTIQAQNAGDYSVEVTNNDECRSRSTPETVCIPIPVIAVSGESLLESTAGAAYQWYWDDEPIEGATSRQYVAENPGDYYVEVENDTGCVDRSLSVSVDVVGLEDKSYSRVELFPNPVEQVLHISTEHQLTAIMIYDMLGKVVYRKDTDIAANQQIDMSGVPAGVYMVRCMHKEATIYRTSIIKQ